MLFSVVCTRRLTKQQDLYVYKTTTDAEIYGPIGGNLYIYANNTGKNTVKQTKIYSYNTTNIVVNITENTEKDGGKQMKIYGSSVEDTLYISCGADCKELYVECPVDSSIPRRLNNAQCIIDCRYVTENDWCKEMEIYTHYGTPKDVQFSDQNKKENSKNSQYFVFFLVFSDFCGVMKKQD